MEVNWLGMFPLFLIADFHPGETYYQTAVSYARFNVYRF